MFACLFPANRNDALNASACVLKQPDLHARSLEGKERSGTTSKKNTHQQKRRRPNKTYRLQVAKDQVDRLHQHFLCLGSSCCHLCLEKKKRKGVEEREETSTDSPLSPSLIFLFFLSLLPHTPALHLLACLCAKPLQSELAAERFSGQKKKTHAEEKRT